MRRLTSVPVAVAAVAEAVVDDAVLVEVEVEVEDDVGVLVAPLVLVEVAVEPFELTAPAAERETAGRLRHPRRCRRGRGGAAYGWHSFGGGWSEFEGLAMDRRGRDPRARALFSTPAEKASGPQTKTSRSARSGMRVRRRP